MEKRQFEIPKPAVYASGILLILAAAGFLMLNENGSGPAPQDKPVPESLLAESGDFQEVVIGMRNYNYFPNTVSVKAGIPVKLRLDDSVYGCFRDFTIRDLGVRKYLRTPSDYIEFTPAKPGTYTFACSMGMGFGKLVVT